MQIIKTSTKYIALLVLLMSALSISSVWLGTPTYAQDNTFPAPTPQEDPAGLIDCNGIKVTIDVGCVEGADNPILAYLGGIINFLAAGVGLVVTGMIIVGGIQYITAGGVPQKIEAARHKITNAIIALVAFLFLYGILQWLIPGGFLNGNNGNSPPPCNPNTQICPN